LNTDHHEQGNAFGVPTFSRLIDYCGFHIGVDSISINCVSLSTAAALEIKTAKGRAILILDKNFIGKNAPEINASWLTEIIKVSND
jgi:phosphotransferase system IIA component